MSETPKLEFGLECRIAYDLCCCCLSGGDLTNMSVYSENTGTTESYFALINRCYNAEVIIPEEPLNRYNICNKCRQRLIDSYLFKCQVIKVQSALKGFLDEFALKTDGNVDIKLDRTMLDYLETDKDKDNNSDFRSGDDGDMDAQESEPTESLSRVVPIKKPLITSKKKKRKRSDVSFKRCHPEIYAVMDFTHKQCRRCKKKFMNDHKLKQHMNEHFPNHICEHCGKGFATKRRCVAHKRCHKKTPLKCGRCDKTFDTSNQRDNHVRKHSERPSYICPRCKERFNTFYSRQKHLRDIHNDSLDYTCKYCNYTCLTSSTLNSHIKTNHSMRVRAHACHLCIKEFYDKRTLKSHLLVHTNLKSLKCCECNKLFMRKKNLVQHMKHHSLIRDYMCSHCGHEFVQKCSLKWHILKKHEKEVSP